MLGAVAGWSAHTAFDTEAGLAYGLNLPVISMDSYPLGTLKCEV